MDSEAAEQQIKQDRHRTRWTASLDKIFADLVVDQIRQGNRPNNVFDKKTWNHIRNEFNTKTDLNFNNNQLRKHLDVLRTRYHNLRSAVDQHDAVEDPCYIGFDLWEDIGAQPRPESTSKTKECPIYEQLCTIFADSGVDGKYAQSSHYEDLNKPGPDPLCLESGTPLPKTPSSKLGQGNGSSQQNMSRSMADRKRKREMVSSTRESSRAQEIGDAMAKAMLEMVDSSRLKAAAMPQSNEKFSITNCIRALDEIEGITDFLYYAALDLFEDAMLREMFLSLRSNQIRLTWLQGKCSTLPHGLGIFML